MDKSKLVVLLDNGHGENTPGKRSPILDDGRQLFEWSYVREIVKLITQKLDKENVKYFLVHPEDKEFPPLFKDLNLRTTRANQVMAEGRGKGLKYIFISVHVNAATGKWGDPNGWMVYIHHRASSDSLKLAQCLYAEAEKRGLKGNRSVPQEKTWRADFYVLRKTNMPAVLTENLFMDNLENVKFLLSDEGKETIADIHVEGIKKFIELTND